MFRSYLKIALRNLQRNKTFTAINIFGLATGTLCCLYIILYVQDQYSFDKQLGAARDNIYRVDVAWSTQGDISNWATVTAPVAPALKNDFAEVEQYARLIPVAGMKHHLLRYKNNLLYLDNAVFADSTLFELFNFHFVEGNPHKALSLSYSVVLIETAAQKLFGNENPLGKIVQIDNGFGKNDFTVTGVIDESLGKSNIHSDFFLSMDSGGFGSYFISHNSWTDDNIVITYAKLRPKTDIAALERKLPAFVNKYAKAQLKGKGMEKRLYFQALNTVHTTTGLKGPELVKPVNSRFLYVLVLIAALIQFTACINFMNLSTARAFQRAKEVGVRKVIGAVHSDLLKQFLGESFILAFAGVLIAMPLLVLAMPYFNMITGVDIGLHFLSDFRLCLILAGMISLTGFAAGCYPAFYLSSFKAVNVLKGNFTSQISAAGIRRSLVIFQFVLSIVLIVAIIIIYSQLNYLKNKDLGFDKEQKIGFSFHTQETTSHIPAFVADLSSLAGVKSVSRTDNLPGLEVQYDLHVFTKGGNMTAAPDAGMVEADENFIKTTGIKLAAGRDFRQGDSARVIINESLAHALGLNIDGAPGTQLFSQLDNGALSEFEIAGVIKNYNYNSLHNEIKPLFIRYIKGDVPEILVSTESSDYKKLLEKMENLWSKHFHEVPFEYSFLDEAIQRQYKAEITLSNIINAFALIAILISSLGLFGLTAFIAEQRNKEIGIRKILGADVLGIVCLLSNKFLKLVVIAIAIAIPIAAWIMSNWLQEFAYRINITWWMFALAAFIAILIALVTVSFQAIKAAIVRPLNSLRTE